MFRWTKEDLTEDEQWTLWCSCEHDILGFVLKEVNKDTGKATYRPLDSTGNYLGALAYTFPWDAAAVLEGSVIEALKSSRHSDLTGDHTTVTMRGGP